jgi:Fur family peroxide stress response transcriptional regulator
MVLAARHADLHELQIGAVWSYVRRVRTPVALTEVFRQQGLKVTPQRQLLFRLLHDNPTHPSADSLYAVASAHMPGISLRTIYQTLTDLAAMGELQVLTIGSGPQRFDPNLAEHHHAECDRCGRLRDVYLDPLPQSGVRGLDGFQTHSTAIVFRGRCDDCIDPASVPQNQPQHHHTIKEHP